MHDVYPSRVGGSAALLPRVDPVVHSGWNDAAPLGAADAAAFEQNGYVVIEGLFSPEEVALLQAETASLLADPGGLDPDTIILEPDGAEVRSVFRIHDQNPVLARLAADARLVNVARFLLGDDVYVHQSRLNYKPGFHGKEFYWHSDFETWHVEDGMPRMRALSMSLLLAANTRHNGPLMLIPGSHKTYVTCMGETPDEHYRSSLRRQQVGVPDEDTLAVLVDEHGIAAPTGEAGTVIVFDCNVMHGSNSNITPWPRANAFIVYNAVSNRLVEPFGAPAPRPDFVATRQARPLRPLNGPLTGGRR
jgi:ectoine hydroxylase